MDRLIPANEFPNAFLDADGGPVPELTLGAAQVRRGQPHVAGLLPVALDPHGAPSSPPAGLRAADGAMGPRAAASSAKGAGVASPYTDDDEPNTIRRRPARRAASSTRTVPVTLVSP